MDGLTLEQVRDDVLPILLVLLAGLIVLRFARRPIRGLLQRIFERQVQPITGERLGPADVKKRVDTVETLAVSTLRFVVGALVAVIILALLDLGPIIAAFGIVIAAIAFAGQDFVRDYLAGLVILLENQFYVGDVIQVGIVSGTVEDFTLRRTNLRDLNGTLHIVANGEIRIASNQTRGYGGINLEIPVAYDADVDRAMAIIAEVGAAMKADPEWTDRILEPPTALRVETLGDLGMSIKVVGKVRAGEQWTANGEVRRRILAAFAAEHIDLPNRSLVAHDGGEQPPTESDAASTSQGP
jgi:small conductance mechanosensitive channel